MGDECLNELIDIMNEWMSFRVFEDIDRPDQRREGTENIREQSKQHTLFLTRLLSFKTSKYHNKKSGGGGPTKTMHQKWIWSLFYTKCGKEDNGGALSGPWMINKGDEARAPF